MGENKAINLMSITSDQVRTCILNLYSVANNAENCIMWYIDIHPWANIGEYKEISRYNYVPYHSIEYNFTFTGDNHEPVINITPTGVNQVVYLSIIPLGVRQ